MIEPNPANDLIVTTFGVIGLLFILPGLIIFYYQLMRSDKEVKELYKPMIATTLLLFIGYAFWVIATIAALTIETEFGDINYLWGILGIIPALFFPGGIWFIKTVVRATKK